MNFDVRCEVKKSHDFAELMLLFERIELLLNVLRDCSSCVACDPRVLQSRCSVIAERRWIRAKPQEEVLRKSCKVLSETPLNRLALNILQLHAVVLLALLVARVLAAG